MKTTMENNSIMHLNLYKEGTTWFFDDPLNNIQKEPFVLGMSEIITEYTGDEANTCDIFFSHDKFPESSTLSLIKEESNGGWYKCEETKQTGWLCPVTRIYMGGITNNIYFKVN